MREPKSANPFYAVLIVVGVAFALTACAYCVMTVRGQNPQRADEGGLVGLMDEHGLAIMVVELILLGLSTVLAIGTDDFWTRRAANQRTEDRGQRTGGKLPVTNDK